MNKKLTGNAGEKAVASYLKKNKYKILETNFRSPFGEIDIIAEKKGTVCFVEVKTRNTTEFGSGKEAVGYFKQQKIIKTAQFYISKGNSDDYNYRFDVADVCFDGVNCDIEYISDAFSV